MPGAFIIPPVAVVCAYGAPAAACVMLSRLGCCMSCNPDVSRSNSSGCGLFRLCRGEVAVLRCGCVISGYNGVISEPCPPNGLVAILSFLDDPMPGLISICADVFGGCCWGIAGWFCGVSLPASCICGNTPSVTTFLWYVVVGRCW